MSNANLQPATLRGPGRLWAWLSNDDRYSQAPTGRGDAVDWLRAVPFWLFHLACLGVFWTGASAAAVVFALAAYWIRMFFVTAFYHRYFSHRAYTASRPMQFLFAVLGCTAGQRGPLWWAPITGCTTGRPTRPGIRIPPPRRESCTPIRCGFSPAPASRRPGGT